MNLVIEFESRMAGWNAQSPGPKEFIKKFMSDVIVAVLGDCRDVIKKAELPDNHKVQHAEFYENSTHLLVTNVLRVMRSYCDQWNVLSAKYPNLFKHDGLRKVLKTRFGTGDTDALTRAVVNYL